MGRVVATGWGSSGLFNNRLAGAELWDQNQQQRWLSCVFECVCVWVCMFVSIGMVCVCVHVIVSLCA